MKVVAVVLIAGERGREIVTVIRMYECMYECMYVMYVRLEYTITRTVENVPDAIINNNKVVHRINTFYDGGHC